MSYKEFYFDATQIGKQFIRLLRASTITYAQSTREKSSTIHSHDFYELLFVYDGGGKFYIDGNLTTVETGDLLLIAPQQKHSEITTPPREFCMYSLAFTCVEELLPGIILHYPASDAKTLSTEIAGLLAEHEQSKEYAHLFCQNIAENIMIDVLRRLRQVPAHDPAAKYMTQVVFSIRQVRDYIDQNFNIELTVGRLAALACLSTEHFIRSFKRLTGISPMQYVITKRIDAATYSLIYTDKTIKTICYEIGFSDINNFVRKFKSLMGVTPNEYKKLHHVH